ncbi:feruloyl-CoA synthase [Povalibacter uvarum]|uniref:Feruloyl-CoA synthase n=1 Tax=Povalibacter uvarum TaxID=732238 RepID=A0A841HJS0_9GAMM|nr:AMP-binding protein [Povalibacter uvarum]MBB6092478.1 feruloyl-CoA synthase [Povalibacter uvarum]
MNRKQKAAERPLNEYPMRTLERPAPSIEVRQGDDGIVYLSCGIPYEPGLPSLIDYFSRSVELRPDSTFLAERKGTDWRRVSYREAWRDTGAIATWLMRQGFGPDSAPVMILSENSIEHALLTLGALRAGAAVVPVSPTYSFGAELTRLGYALELIEPGVVFALDGERYGPALETARAPGRRLVTGADLREMLNEYDEAAVTERRKAITEDTIAKILLTSGSTGRPKGVVNTHGNLAASVQMIRLVSEPFTLERHHVIVDWLPWHHTFGGNAQFNGVLANAGTLYIDDGRPMPGLFEKTIENLRDVSPSGFGCVPAVYGLLADALERDDDFRHKFFKNLRWLSYGGALLPQPLWERIQRLAVKELGERLPFGTGWGMTETSATGIAVYWNTERTGLVGLPQPGVTLKLLPVGDRIEVRIKGPHIMPRYYRNDVLNAAAFDEEGYFKTGDAARWVDARRPLEGLEFAGRIAEDFKLQSGTWVQGSIVRRDLVAALQPYVTDAVICAPDQPWLGALVWLNVADQEPIRAALAAKLANFNRARQGGASTVSRLLVLTDPPSAEAGEVTDKRSINQRRVLERRADDVNALYAPTLDPRVVLPIQGIQHG